MKASEVKIGGQYYAKISRRLVPVRLVESDWEGGWFAVNLRTGRRVWIRSARRLRGPVPLNRSGANEY